jgi:hypothetical protein
MDLGLIHLPLAGYFAAIGGLLYLVSPQLLRSKQSRGSGLFLVLAAVSLLATWTYMFLYFRHSFREAAAERGVAPEDFSTKTWLEDVSLVSTFSFVRFSDEACELTISASLVQRSLGLCLCDSGEILVVRTAHVLDDWTFSSANVDRRCVVTLFFWIRTDHSR